MSETDAAKRAYAVVFERGANNYSAYCPDVLGCVAAADDWDEIQTMIREALEFHIETMAADGDPLPQATMSVSEAMRYHSEVEVDGSERHLEVETTVAMIEVNMPTPHPVSAEANVGD